MTKRKLSELMLADFHREAALTRPMLEAVPEDRLDWKPHEKSWTLGMLAGHIAENPSWVAGMVEDEMDMAAMADWKPFDPESKTELLEAYDKNVEQFDEVVGGRDDAFMEGIWQMKNGDDVSIEQVEKHMQHCRSCYSRKDVERALTEHIRRSQKEKAPEALHSRLRKLMDEL